MTNPEYINKLTQKFAAAKKIASMINQSGFSFPGASQNIAEFQFRDPQTDEWYPADLVSRDNRFLTFGTYPTNNATTSFLNRFPTSNLGDLLSTWNAGEETPATTSGYVAIPGVSNNFAQLINGATTGLGYAGVTEGARRLGNTAMGFHNTRQLINPLTSIRGLSPDKIDAALMDMGVPIDGNKASIPGVPFSSNADEVMSKRQAIAEYISMQAKDKTLTPGEYGEYRVAADATPGLTLEQFRTARGSSAAPAAPASTGRLGHHHRPVAVPAPAAPADARPRQELDFNTMQISHGSDKNQRSNNVELNRSHAARQRIPLGRFGPFAAGAAASILPWFQSNVNYGSGNAYVVPVDDALPGDPHTGAPITDQSFDRVRRQAQRHGVQGRGVDFNDPLKVTDFNGQPQR
jgi:hypothetical protein